MIQPNFISRREKDFFEDCMEVVTTQSGAWGIKYIK